MKRNSIAAKITSVGVSIILVFGLCHIPILATSQESAWGDPVQEGPATSDPTDGEATSGSDGADSISGSNSGSDSGSDAPPSATEPAAGSQPAIEQPEAEPAATETQPEATDEEYEESEEAEDEQADEEAAEEPEGEVQVMDAPIVRSQSGSAYAILTDAGELIFFRSSAVGLTNNTTMKDVIIMKGATSDKDVKCSGTVYTGVEGLNFKPEWGKGIRSVRVTDDALISPLTCENWFSGCASLVSCDLNGFNTAQTSSMASMFTRCQLLSSLDLNGFFAYGAGNLTDMSSMFESCTRLHRLAFPSGSLGTANLLNMSKMFYDCPMLQSVDVSAFNTAKVTDMQGLFFNCISLSSLDLSGFDTTNVKNMSQMFMAAQGRTSSLTTLDLSTFKTQSVTKMSQMFANCSSLTSITWNSSLFKTHNVATMESMFAECSALSELDVSSFDTGKVTTFNKMFSGCTSLVTLNCASWTNTNVTDMEAMFQKCSALESVSLNWFGTNSANTMREMFQGCSKLSSVNVSSFKTANVTTFQNMFDGCSRLSECDISLFDTKNALDLSAMFRGCSAITRITLPSSFLNLKTKKAGELFSGCVLLDTLNVDNSTFNTRATKSELNDVARIFYNCAKITTLDLANFDTKQVDKTSGYDDMFTGCVSLDSLTLGDCFYFDRDNGSKAGLASARSGGSWVRQGSDPLETYSSTALSAKYKPRGGASTATYTWDSTIGAGYKVQYFSGAATAVAEFTYDYDAAMELKSAELLPGLSAPGPGWELYGWTESATSSTEGVLPVDSSITKSESEVPRNTTLNLYAVWHRDVSVTYEKGGRNVTGMVGDSSVTQSVNAGTNASANAVSQTTFKLRTNQYRRDSHRFTGWLLDGESTARAENTDYAAWTPAVGDQPVKRAVAQWQSQPMVADNVFLAAGSIPTDLELVQLANVRSDGADIDQDNVMVTRSFDTSEPSVTGTVKFSLGDDPEDDAVRKTVKVYVFDHVEYDHSTHAAIGANDLVGGSALTVAQAAGLLTPDSKADERLIEKSGAYAESLEGATPGKIDVSVLSRGFSRNANTGRVDAGMYNMVLTANPSVSVQVSIKPNGEIDPAAGTAYAMRDASGTLTFFRSEFAYQPGVDVEAADLNGKIHQGVQLYGGFEDSDAAFAAPWGSEKTSITSVSVAEGQTIKPDNSAHSIANWFSGCTALVSCDLSQFDVSAVTDAASLFEGDEVLTSVNLGGWNTGALTDVNSMFKGCGSLTAVDIRGWDTANVTSMASMFAGCSSLVTLDVLGFDTAKVTDFSHMFDGCANVGALAVAGFDTGSATMLAGMFKGCAKLESLDVARFNTARVTDFSELFAGCASLGSVDNMSFNTDSATTLAGMFQGCSKLGSLDVSGFQTANVTDFSNLFSGCEKLATIDVSNFDTGKAVNLSGVFQGCESVSQLDVSRFATASVKHMGSIFKGCKALKKLDLGSFDTRQLVDDMTGVGMDDMLAECTSLETLVLGANFTFRGKVFTREEAYTDEDGEEQTRTVEVSLAPQSANLASSRPANDRYSWVRTDPMSATPYSSEQLAAAYDGATMAGTYTWQGNPYTVAYHDGTEALTRTEQVPVNPEDPESETKEVQVSYQAPSTAAVSYHLCGQEASLKKVGAGADQVDLTAPASQTTWTFYGWSTSPSSTERVYRDGDTLPANLDVAAGGTYDLYAVWQRSATLSYAAGSGASGSMASAASDQLYGRCAVEAPLTTPEFTLASNGFVKSKGAFLGWKVGDGAAMQAPGVSVSDWRPAVDAKAELVATAQWGECDITAHNVYLQAGSAKPSDAELKELAGMKLDIKDAAGQAVDLQSDVAVLFAANLAKSSRGNSAGKLTFTLQTAGGSSVAGVQAEVDVYVFDHVAESGAGAARTVIGADNIGFADALTSVGMADILSLDASARDARLIDLAHAKAQVLADGSEPTVLVADDCRDLKTELGEYPLKFNIAADPSATVQVKVSEADDFGPTDGTAYAVLADDGTLTFFRSSHADYAAGADKRAVDLAGTIYSGTLYTGVEGGGVAPWSGELARISRVVVADRQAIVPGKDSPTAPVSMARWFSGCYNLTSCDLSSFDVSNVNDMQELFKGCSKLRELDLSGFSTKQVNAADGMKGFFANCTSLAVITLGEGFSFSGDDSLVPADAGLSTARADNDGFWVRESTEGERLYKSNELAGTYAGSTMAGVYVWRASPFTVHYFDGDVTEKGYSKHYYDQTQQLKSAEELGLVAPGESWTFAGWSHEPGSWEDDCPDKARANDVVDDESPDVNLYAVWKRSAVMTYEGGVDAQGAMEATAAIQRYNRSTPEGVLEPVNLELPSCNFTRQNAVFKGWLVGDDSQLYAAGDAYAGEGQWVPGIGDNVQRTAVAQWDAYRMAAHDVFLQKGETLGDAVLQKRAGLVAVLVGDESTAVAVDSVVDVDLAKPGSGKVTFKLSAAPEISTTVDAYVFSHVVIDEATNNAIAANDVIEDSDTAMSVADAQAIVAMSKTEGDAKLIERVGARALNLETGTELPVDVADRGGFSAEPGTYELQFHANPTVTSEVQVVGSPSPIPGLPAATGSASMSGTPSTGDVVSIALIVGCGIVYLVAAAIAVIAWRRRKAE